MTGYARHDPTLRGSARLMALYGAALGVFAAARTPELALLAQFAVGYCYFAVMTGLQTLIQQLVDDSRRGRVMSLFQVAWAGLVPFGGLAAPVSAQEDGWTPELSMQYRAIGGTALSPDGSRVAFTVREPLMEGEKSEYLTHIWVVSADGSRNVQFTRGDKSTGGAS